MTAGSGDGLDELVGKIARAVADCPGVRVGGDDRPRAAADRVQARTHPGMGDVDGNPRIVHRTDQNLAEGAEAGVLRLAAAITGQAPVVIGRLDHPHPAAGEHPDQLGSGAQRLGALKMEHHRGIARRLAARISPTLAAIRAGTPGSSWTRSHWPMRVTA